MAIVIAFTVIFGFIVGLISGFYASQYAKALAPHAFKRIDSHLHPMAQPLDTESPEDDNGDEIAYHGVGEPIN